LKASYENQLLLKKIIDYETHPHQYHPSKIKIKKCPAFTPQNFAHRKFSEQVKVNQENFVNIIY
jgi:hypothetical protein